MTVIRRKGFELTVRGHAGFGRAGEDIVCAAVSALCYTLAENLIRLADRDSITLTFEKGCCRIICPRLTGKPRSIAAAFDFTMTGLELLASSFPENVRIEENQ